MLQRFFAFFFLSAALLMAEGSILRMNYGSDPYSLDPRKARTIQDRSLARALFEGLFCEQDGKIENGLVKSFEMRGNVYIFELKKSHWSNNDELTAYDFERSWKRALSPDFPCPLANGFFLIKGAKKAKAALIGMDEVGIKAIDETHLRVELEKRADHFLQLLTFPIFYPVHEKMENWDGKEKSFICNGPFKLKKWAKSDYLKLTKNEAYFDAGVVKLKSILFVMVSPETELDMFEKGELDFAGSPLSIIPTDAIASLKSRKEFNIKPFLGTAFLRVNTLNLKDKNLRNGLAAIIDRRAIVDYVLQGGQKPAWNLVPKDNEENLFKVQAPFEKRKEIKLSYVSNMRSQSVVQVLQRQIEDGLKIRVILDPLEGKVLYEKLSKGNYDLALGSWVADFPDPLDFLEVFASKNNGINNTFWENETYSSLLLASYESDKKEELKKSAEKILLEEAPIIPLYHLSMVYLKQDKVKGIYLPPSGLIDFKKAYTQETSKIGISRG